MATLIKILDKTKLQDKTIFQGPQGWVDGVYYIDGAATDLDSSGNGTWNGTTYVGGVPQE